MYVGSEFGQERFKPTVGVIFAIVISFSVLSAFISILLWRTGYFSKPKKKKVDHDNLPIEHHYYFSIKDISAATENFRPENKIGEGGFGPVYKVKMKNQLFNERDVRLQYGGFLAKLINKYKLSLQDIVYFLSYH